MIKSLLIKNFILIDEMFLEFKDGFNVLIGETGAGKSIILKAIDTVLGARITKDVIFNSQKNALIEITFSHSKKDLQNLASFELEEQTVISREITPTTQKCRLNGALVNLETIKELREHLLDIHSQHQSYTYVAPKYHIELLDAYCKGTDEDFSSSLADYKNSYLEYQKTTKKLEQLRENNSKNLQEIDFLKFQLNEIDCAQIYENEEEELNTELEVLSNVQELKELTYGVHYALGSDDALLEALSKIKFSIAKAAEFDNRLEEVQNSFVEGFENLKYCSDFLRDYSQNLEDNPQRLNELNERLSLILKLKRKYGDIFKTREELDSRLKSIEGDSSSIDELEARQSELSEKIESLSKKLTSKRTSYASELSKLIEQQLKDLELTKAKFEIDIKKKDYDSKGTDEVEFLITTNVSSALAPLAKVASGGEISRIMLAIKTVFAQVDSVATVIFDEIDTGISGKASNAVAKAICKLACDTQVFAITHQPIIAARANAFFKVEKSQDGTTKVEVKRLDNDDDKLNAIASLASGDVNSISISFAKDLLKS